MHLPEVGRNIKTVVEEINNIKDNHVITEWFEQEDLKFDDDVESSILLDFKLFQKPKRRSDY